MKTFISTIRQSAARWLLIYGVLAGLFFSSGEGIQLLPFPLSAGNKASEINASSRENNSKSYAFTVFSSRNAFTLLKSKVQKDANPHLFGERLTVERSETKVVPDSSAVRNLEKGSLPYSFPVPGSRSKRAPPVI